MAVMNEIETTNLQTDGIDPSRCPAVELRSVNLSYQNHLALKSVDLTVAHGEVVAVVGPSGSGKSSLLRLIAGFLDPSQGAVVADGEIIADERTSVAPQHRRIGFVFQHFALWPHMTVQENVSYPWKARDIALNERSERANELLRQVGLAGFERRMPGTLSGGQQQRVALARGLAGDPRLLLLDEPLSSVDAARRDDLQTLIADIVRDRGLTTLITTHDQREATMLADRVLVLNNGAVAQFATPIDLYERPSNGFVARFMGALNVFDVQIHDRSMNRVTATLADGGHQLVARVTEPSSLQEAVLVVRPEMVKLTAPHEGDQNGVVVRSVLADGRTEVRIDVNGVVVRAYEAGVPHRHSGEIVGLILDNCSVLVSERASS